MILSKKLFPFLIALLLFFSLPKPHARAEMEEGEEMIHISLEIDKAQDSMPIALSFPPFRKYISHETVLNEAGKAELEFPFERSSYFLLRMDKVRCRIYAEPGDSIRIRANAEDIRGSIDFEGDGAARNQYLFERSVLLRDSIGRAYRMAFQHSVKDFLERTASLDSTKQELLEEHEEDLDQAFIEAERSHLRMKDLLQRLKYEQFHAYMTDISGDSLQVPDTFYDPVRSFEVSRSHLIRIPIYYKFLQYYGNRLYTEAVDADSTLADSIRVQEQYRLLKEEVDDDTTEAAFLASTLYGHLTRRGAEGTEPLLKALEEKGSFGSVTDSLWDRYEEWQALAPGKEAPSFSYPNVEGDTVSLEDLRGKYVYIDAWATWCGPCRKEIPHLKELESKFEEDEVAFVSISLDNEQAKDKWKEMVEEKKLGGYQLFANGEAFASKLAKDYLIRSIPRFILIDPEGRIVDVNEERPSGNAEEKLRDLLE